MVTRLAAIQPETAADEAPNAGVPSAPASMDPAAVPAEIHWALLADPHISADPSRSFNGFRPSAHVAAAVSDVLKASPEAALLAGDLAWALGLPEDYRQLRGTLEPLARQMPLCLMLGNHDNRHAFLTEFFPPLLEAGAAIEKSVVVVEHGPIRCILLDSLIRTDIVAGLVGKAQRCWLQKLLEASDQRPTLIVVHHPLDDEDDSLLDGDRLFRLVRPFPQVKAILTAHEHVYRTSLLDGIHIVKLPAVGMPFDEREPVGWLEASLSATRGVFTFRSIGENRAADGAAQTLTWR